MIHTFSDQGRDRNKERRGEGGDLQYQAIAEHGIDFSFVFCPILYLRRVGYGEEATE